MLLICSMYNQSLSLYLCDCTLANRNISVTAEGLSTFKSFVSSFLSPDLEEKKRNKHVCLFLEQVTEG